MNNEIKELIDAYIDEFLKQDIVKKYFALEKTINESEYLSNLQNEMKKAQKELALSINDGSYQSKKEKFLKLQDAFYNDPHVVNYHLLQDEIYKKICELKTKINN